MKTKMVMCSLMAFLFVVVINAQSVNTTTDSTVIKTGIGGTTKTTETTGTVKQNAGQSNTTGIPQTNATIGIQWNEDNMEFVNTAASGGLMEVALGNLAQTNASSQAVKDFGSMMVKDHSRANAELKAVVTKNGGMVPEVMMESHKHHVDELTKLTGAEFDKEYISMMVEDHKEDIKLFEEAAANLELSADIRNFAQTTLPTLKIHLSTAEKIVKDIDAMSTK